MTVIPTASNLAGSLRAVLAGRVIEPADRDYHQMRTVFPGGVDRHPSFIVRPRTAGDVQHTVRLVRNAGVPLAIRSGGHTIHSVTDGGVVCDLRDMSGLHVDAARRMAWAETGLTAAAYSAGVGAFGMVTGFYVLGFFALASAVLIAITRRWAFGVR